jgi:tetrahydromethanopterin S-methyltransferase subunit A
MGCKPCVPVPAFNEFAERMDTLSSLEESEIQPVKVSTFPPSEFEYYPWPVQPGDYDVFQPKAPIAVALLGSREDLAFVSSLEGIAIAGSLTTENLGVEHILKNVIANPFIRHVLLFGKDVSGHLPGNALISLVDNGIGNSHKILGATGARALLKNVLTSEVEHFRRQITIHNLMDQHDFTSLRKQVLMLSSSEPVPFKTGLRVDLVGVTEATPASKLRLDPEGYFVVMVRKGRKNPIYVEHYRNDGRITNIVEGKDAATVCSTILRMGLVSQMDHAAYLGRELAKAELSLLTDKVYIQDRAQGDLACE